MREYAVLYAAELSRAAGSRRENARLLSDAGRSLLARGLLELYHIPHLPETARNENGKPYLPEYPDIHFNISHSGSLAVCVFAPVPIGIDIQEVCRNPSRVIRRFGGEALYAKYEAAENRDAFFLSWWTREESYAKWKGSTLAGCIGGEKEDCCFWQAAVREGFCCTLCAERRLPTKICQIPI